MFSCIKWLKNNIIIISLAFLFCFWFATRCLSCCWYYGYVVTENVHKKEVISKQQLCTCTTLIGSFLCHHCATTRWKCLIDAFIFYGLEQKQTTTNLYLQKGAYETTTPTATTTLQNNRFSEQKQWLCTLCTCVLHCGTFLCRHLLNDDVKWPNSRFWGGR